MKAEYITPFIQAAQAVFKTFLNADIKLGEVSLISSPLSVCDMVIMIGVVGKIRGQVCMELTFETGKKMVSTMMGGVTIDNMDEIGISAIAELGDMIMSKACTVFLENKINIDITPPTIFTGDKIKISSKVATIRVPLILKKYGIININITAEGML